MHLQHCVLFPHGINELDEFIIASYLLLAVLKQLCQPVEISLNVFNKFIAEC